MNKPATARSRTYDLFARLYLHGITPDLPPILGAVPDLSAHIPAHFDADEAAAAHQHLFRFNVFPHENIFLDAESLLGGRVSDSVWDFYRQAGFQPQRSDSGPDHIGNELALLAFLTGAEADAWEDDETAQIPRLQALQRRFLDDHLLRWLPALVQAIRQQEQPFFSTLADLTLAFTLDHRAALGDDLLARPLDFTLPPLPALLDDDKTGLKEIAAYLLTPAYSGIYLSRDDIGRLGRAQQLPRGFGERKQMLTNLLRAAAEYDSLAATLDELQKTVQNWQRNFSEMAAPAPSIAAISSVWQTRLTATDALLQRLRASADA